MFFFAKLLLKWARMNSKKERTVPDTHAPLLRITSVGSDRVKYSSFFLSTKQFAYSDSVMICSKIASTRRLASKHSSESSPHAIFLFSSFRSFSSWRISAALSLVT